MYGLKPPDDGELASKLMAYEKKLEAIQKDTLHYYQKRISTPISALGQYTTPYVTSDQWGTFISKYTNGTYAASDYIHYRPHTTEILVKLFKSKAVRQKGLRYLVAWSFYRQLVEFTEPYMFLRGRSASDACYEHVKKVMHLAVLSPYFHSEIPPHIVPETKRMVSQIRATFLEALEYSSWLGLTIREAAIRRLNNMTSYVGSPGMRSDPEFVELVYKPYPDAPLDILFPTWIKARSLSSHYIWTDQTAALYDEARHSPYYTDHFNDFILPATSLLRPFMYKYGVSALSYGGLGKLIGHEIMHGFDVSAIQSLKEYDPEGMKTVITEYTKRALCLRESHKSVLSVNAQGEMLNETRDSENLADLVGAKIAYDAFASLAAEERDQTLAGLDMSAEQLFFVNSCAIFCAEHAVPGQRYAPYRSRCIVPLINMPEFSRAFGCAAGTPMNPLKKCTFW
ncbi:hypothetical protein MTO96_029124 [Rhipicephalus appendiculatus]